ncbi:hypothetical protein [Aureliella helgolandensis]|uniref:Uncharacterized protein n=1 Tax=Aureliella helgolandensis TaxID=2527968 RepID=A0A518GA04_9BACT|nr:hypothetical protein [Aureliella helgolandensis]QDV25427.1 hypothetical protein Q31a_37530 [Aureliella helgolandensis]
MNMNPSPESDSDIEKQLYRAGQSLRENISLSERVLEQLEIKDAPQPIVRPAPTTRWSRFTHFGELTMLQKLSITSLAASATLVLLAWVATSATHTSLAQVVENVRKATSYQADVRMDAADRNVTGRIYWRAPMDVRMEFDNRLGEPREIDIFFRNKPGIGISNKTRTYRIHAARSGVSSPIMQLQELPNFEAEAQRRLGTKRIQGIECEGFEIEVSKIDPNVGAGTLTVWVNPVNQLPNTVSISFSDLASPTMIFENIIWNNALEDALFSTAPPVGYELAQPAKHSNPSVAEQVSAIIQSLRIFAELNDGKYPQVSVVYGDVIQAQLLKLGGYSMPVDREQVRDKEYQEIMESTRGWAIMNGIMRDNAYASYHGFEVTPQDSDQALFQWRLDNGHEQVIYGDLHAETLER